MTSLSIHRRKGEAAVILDIDGRIDLFTSPQLRTALLSALEEDALAILLNFSSVPYVDSSGLATVIEGLQRSKKVGRKYALFGLTEGVHGLFEIAKLTRAFSIHADETSALEALRGDVGPMPPEREP